MADDKVKTIGDLKAEVKKESVPEKESKPSLEDRIAALEEEIKKCVHAH